VLEVFYIYLFTQERIPMRIKPLTLGQKIAMTMTNDNAPVTDAHTLVDRLEEHSDSSHKTIRDLPRKLD
jgi:hypothetical protein